MSRPTASLRSLALLTALTTSLALTGCGEREPERHPVAGKVSLDGKPLATGKVTFVPLDGPTASVAEVRDGVFQVDRASGPASGRYQVEIVAVALTGKKIPNPDVPGRFLDEERDLVPERYNLKSELIAEVAPGAQNAFEFALSSERPAGKKTRRR
ncbi:hypothetical protein [Paludisphaera rhizosphaerae]|uniref:hypothetical protein n=1 Tax=Paludisphaera rhizosphaerae TaxID=2711216 RepID=UPI0013EAD031|nr:hypothetical protein [Paludisphaera rhizosphaerae]